MIASGSEDTTFHRGRLDVFLYFNTRVSWFGLFSFGRLSLVIFARYPCSTSAMVLLQHTCGLRGTAAAAELALVSMFVEVRNKIQVQDTGQ